MYFHLWMRVTGISRSFTALNLEEVHQSGTTSVKPVNSQRRAREMSK